MKNELEVDLARLRRHALRTDGCAQQMDGCARSAVGTADGECFGMVLLQVRADFTALQKSCVDRVSEVAAGLRLAAMGMAAAAADYERVDQAVSELFRRGQSVLEGAR